MSENTLKVRLKHAVKTEAEWTSSDPVLLKGETAYSSDKKLYKIGDGTSKWSELSYNSAATLNGLVASVNELNYTKGVTSNIQTQLNNKSDKDHGHSNATTSSSGFMSVADKTFIDNLKAKNLGNFSGKTVNNLKEELTTWLETYGDIPNASCYFISSHFVDNWNNNSTASLTDGVRWTVELNACHPGSDYTLLKITAYSDKSVYYVYRSGGTWGKIRKVLFEGDSVGNVFTATKAEQDGDGNVITSTYETKSDAAAKLNTAKSYADTAATAAANKVKSDLLNGAEDAYDTLKELGELIDDNHDAIDALEIVATGKADKTHAHSISDVTNLQTTLDGKAAKTHAHAISDVTNLQTTLDDKASKTHAHAISDVTNLQSTLDGKQPKEATTFQLHTDYVAVRTPNRTASQYYEFWDGGDLGWAGIKAGQITANGGFVGNLSGNASTATSAAKWTTARKITLTGAVTGNVSIDGSGDVSLATSVNHTHNYAGSSSAGGAANSANKWTTARTLSLTGAVTGNVLIDGSGDVSMETTVNHTHSYLPLSGGTLTVNSYYGLTIKRSDSNGAAISYQNNSGAIGGAGFLSGGTFQISSGTNTDGNIMLATTTAATFPGTVTATTFSGNLSGNASTASKWSTARKISLTGSVTGEVTMDGSGNVSIATTTNHTHNYAGSSSAGGVATSAAKWSTARKITLTGAVTGNVTIDGSGDVSLATSINHTHNYAGSSSAGGAANSAAKWSTGRKITLTGAVTGNVTLDGSEDVTLTTAVNHTHSYAGSSSAGGVATSAAKWATGRKITLTGAVTGNVTIDGSGDVSLATTVNHTHSYLPLTGGTLTGNLTGQHIIGTWLKTTSDNALSTASTKICVQDSNGWIYTRTTGQILSDIGAAAGAATSAATAAAAGWYRIATTGAGIANNVGIFLISAYASGYHSNVIVTAGTAYGTADGSNVQVLHCSHYSGTAINKVRIVYHTTYSNNYAYVEVYKNPAVAVTISVKQLSGAGWSLVAPSTAGSVPSGYSNKEVALSNNTIVAGTFSGALSGNATSATTATSAAKWTTARKISLTGSVTGSVSIDGSGDVSIATTTNHTHNYAGSSSAGGVANSAAKWSTARKITLTGAVTGNVSIDGSGDVSLATTVNHTHLYAGSSSAGGAANSALACTGNSATATKWATARKITLTGAVTGNVSIDGSGDVSLATSVNHTHNYAASSSAGGAATSAAKWSTARKITLTGAVTGNVSIDGSGDVSLATSVNHTHSYAGSSSAGGAATSANKWTTARALTLTGAVTGEASIDGSGNVSLATTVNHTHKYAGSSSAGGAANSASKVYCTYKQPVGIDNVWYLTPTYYFYLPMFDDANMTSENKSLLFNDGIKFGVSEPTLVGSGDSAYYTNGSAILDIGNAIAQGVTGGDGGGKMGSINIYGSNTGYTQLYTANNTTTNQMVYFSSYSGEIGIVSQNCPPKSHATTTATTYGAGNASKYGHVMLSNTYTSAAGSAAASLGASQTALYNAYNKLSGAIYLYKISWTESSTIASGSTKFFTVNNVPTVSGYKFAGVLNVFMQDQQGATGIIDVVTQPNVSTKFQVIVRNFYGSALTVRGIAATLIYIKESAYTLHSSNFIELNTTT